VRQAAATDRLLRQLAIAAWVLTIAATVAALAIRVISGAPPLPNRFSLGDAAISAISLLQVATATVAVLILARLPRQRVGWLLMATGVFYAVSILAAPIAFAAAAEGPTGLTIARWSGWIAWVTSTISGVTIVTIPIVFPDGRLSSPLVGRLVLLFAAPALVIGLAVTLQPGPMVLLTSLDNPIGIGPRLLNSLSPLALGGIAAYTGAPVALAGVSLASRWRQSRGVERQQLKWFMAAAVAMTGALLITGFTGYVLNDGVRNEWPLVVFALAATSMPVAIGIAILRYRLYAIDRLINRTLVYGGVTALLAAVYGASVLLIQAPLAQFAGGRTLAVAGSTLAVAVLFSPVRARVQRLVDRRFYRRRYDAEVAVSSFAARLRDNVELAKLSDEVAGVVNATVAPAAVGLWLRPRGGGR
jgi:hypothetical protein